MNWPYHIARHLSAKEQKSFSKTIIRLAIVAVALSTAVMIIALATVSGFQNGIRSKIIGINGHVVVDDINNVEGSVPVPLAVAHEARAKQILKIPGVTRVSTCLLRPCIVRGEDEIEGMVAKGVDKDYDFSFLRSNLVKGRVPDFTKDTNQALISEVTAKRLHLKPGDHLQAIFFREEMEGLQNARAIAPTIVGIYSTGMEEYDKTLVITYRGLLKKMLKKGVSFTNFEIGLRDYKDADKTAYAIQQILPAGVFNVNTVQRYNRQIFDWLSLLDTNVIIILFLMVLVACINMATTLLILITERTQMVGILKAMGAENRHIRRIFILQALFIAFLGIMAGNVLGFGFCWLQQHYQFLRLNVETYYVNHVLIDVEPWHIPAVNLGTLLLCFVALFLPAMIISRFTPVKTMRFQ